ncbi:BTAD domain-containing putative transcriptional regulator [Streptosporangium sp. NPDC000396]|uniref:AfsR/SARP family transcriptional regulator n=1 Tax=Streptosporangium sp. NPDC000396 TaxID=3366185 RepID=UPI0036856F88
MESFIDVERAPLRKGREQIVVALLGLNLDIVVTSDLMIDAIWGEDPPRTAQNQVAICVSSLRKRLAGPGDSLIATVRSGYILRAENCEVDYVIAQERIRLAHTARADGRAEDARRLLREAMGLWRGETLAGIGSDLLRARAAGVERQRRSIIEECLELEIELGYYRDAINQLTALLAVSPHDERSCVLLMKALYGAGHQAEAMDVYQRIRVRLQDDLGVDPGADLRAAYAAILSGERMAAPRTPLPPRPASDPVSGPLESALASAEEGHDAGREPTAEPSRPSVPRQLPARPVFFSGRDAELGHLDKELAIRQASGATPCLVIVGMGGVGKTTLAVHWAYQVTDRFPDGQLYCDLRSNAGDPMAPSKVLDDLLRGLGVPGNDMPDSLDGRAALFRTLLADKRMLIILDNACDSEQVRPLLPGAAGCVVVVTSRAAMSGLTVVEGAALLRLRALKEEQAERVLGLALGGDSRGGDARGIRDLAKLCDGLPLALRIVAAKLTARPHWTVAELVERLRDERRRLRELSHDETGLLSGFVLSYQGLGTGVARLFRQLGLIDAPDLPGWVASPLTELDMDKAQDMLEELVAAHLLDVTGRDGIGQNRYRMHDLVRLFARQRAMEEDTEDERKAALGRVMGAWMGLVEEAHRRVRGGDYLVMHGMAPRWRIEPAQTNTLLRRPLEWLEAERRGIVSAIFQAADAGLDELCWDLTATVATLFETRGYVDDWRATHERALEAVRRTGNRHGEAAMLYGQAGIEITRDGKHAEDLLERARSLFEEIGDERGIAHVLRSLAVLDRLGGRFDVAMERYRQTLSTLRRVGDHVAQTHTLIGLALIYLERRDAHAARETLTEALTLAEKTGDSRSRAQVLYRIGELRLAEQDFEGAVGAFAVAIDLARALDDTTGEAFLLRALGEAALLQGDLSTARRSLDRAVELASGLTDAFLNGRVCLTLAELRVADGEPSEAEDLLRRAATAFAEVPAAHWELRARERLGALRGRG